MEFLELSPHRLVAVAVAAFLVGFFKSTFSMGIGTLVVPVMVLFWPTRFIMGIIAVLMWLTDFVAIRLFWRQWEWRLVKLVVPGFFLGILIGASLLVQISDFWLRKGIGTACLVFTALQAWREFRGERPPPPIGAWGGFGIGVLGGIISAMFHSGGLVLTLFLLSQGLTTNRLVATILLTWLCVNPVKVSSLWVGGIVKTAMFPAGVLSVPIAFGGSWIGKRFLECFSPRAFNLSVLAISAVAALRLLVE